MNNFTQKFWNKPIIGMIHVWALPWTPKSDNNMKKILEKVKHEANIYKKYWLDSVMIENMHDTPYMNKVIWSEITATMTATWLEVRKILDTIPLWIQILAAGNKEALAVAKACDLDFIRAEGFVFGHVADEWYIESCAWELLRYRKYIWAENIMIFTDIKKKHSSHAITNDVSIWETAHAAEFFMSNWVIVTWVATWSEANLEEIEQVKKSVHIPVLVWSWVNYDNLENYMKSSDWIIIGSHFKENGYWENEIDEKKVEEFMKKVKYLR